ncbi:hypothetical protein GCM10019016_098310 [Streptomyces prasinosporus]|uniref:Uncharacterized protein n=1 Tax=Streptomyces prasinosporus TaxID=68256 RepID=A0ABP6U7P0_9ACTN
MESTGAAVVVGLVFLFAPDVARLLKSVAFRIRAAGEAEVLRAERGECRERRGTGGTSRRGRRG